MNKSALAVLAVPFLLLVGQAESAQPDDFFDWRVTSDVDVIDDSVHVITNKYTNEVEGLGADFASLNIDCDEPNGYPTLRVIFTDGTSNASFFEGFETEVIYRIGTDDPVTQKWAVPASFAVSYRTSYIDDGSDFSAYLGNPDASVLVAAMVEDNSRFIVRASGTFGTVTAIWNIEGLAEVIDECMAVFD